VKTRDDTGRLSMAGHHTCRIRGQKTAGLGGFDSSYPRESNITAGYVCVETSCRGRLLREVEVANQACPSKVSANRLHCSSTLYHVTTVARPDLDRTLCFPTILHSIIVDKLDFLT
jgi:hypothetical protein